MDTPVDVHGRNHKFLLFHPREVLLAGHWVTTPLILSCGIILHSPPVEVGLHGVGWGHLSHAMTDTYTQGKANLWCNKKKLVLVQDVWLSTLVHHFVRGDVCCNPTHHFPCILFPLSLIFFFPLKASTFTSSRSPGFRFEVPIFSCSTVFVGMLLLWIGFAPPRGSVLNLSQMEAMCLSICLAVASLVAASVLPMVGK